jgi:hypothetical protein
LENLIGTAEIRPPGLPPAAILCVRKLHDPLPGTLSLKGYAVRAPQRWEQALAASLGDLARHAARPLYEPVPANANAVIFADRAEMLACLALDWAKDTLAYGWWWRSLLRDLNGSRTVWSAWLNAPQFVPPALAKLAARGEVARVASRMDAPVVGALTRLILSVFNLGHLAAALEENTIEPAVEASDADLPVASEYEGETAPAAHHAGGTAPTTPLARVPPPWDNLVPEVLQDGLTASRRLLVGIAVSLVRDPTRTRTLSFARDTRDWLKAEPGALAIEEIPSASPGRSIPVEKTTRQGEAPQAARRPSVRARDERAARSQGSAGEAVVERAQQAQQAQQGTKHHQENVIEEVARSARQADTLADERTVSATQTATSESTAETEAPILTAFGGLFYLLNLAMYLDFYGDYTTPWKKDLELSIWDFVALVGAELLGGTPPDPVWELLADLAGRDIDDPPGASFTPPDAWHVDPRWLDAFPKADVLAWSVAGGRACVRHPLGFLLVDVPFDGKLSSLFGDVLAAYGQDLVMKEANLPVRPGESPLRRWLGWLMPYVRARLRRALGVNDVDDPAPVLCRHDARIFATLSSVDVLLSLDTLPIEIRLAGLDRNPGWLPAAGRTITFHFESKGV